MPTASTQHSTQHDLLNAQLANSDSATIYTDIPGFNAEMIDDALLAEPPLHIEFDEVRQQWAVRAATPDEVAEAAPAADEGAPKAETESAPKSGKSTSSD